MPSAGQLFPGLRLAGLTDLCMFKEWPGPVKPLSQRPLGTDPAPLIRGLPFSQGHRPASLRPSPLLKVLRATGGKECGPQREKPSNVRALQTEGQGRRVTQEGQPSVT